MLRILAEKFQRPARRYNRAPMKIVHQASLRKLNTFGIDASARICLEVESVADLQAVRADSALCALPRLVLGGGSNVLFTKDFDGLVLHMVSQGRVIDAEDDTHVRVRAQAGENWHEFVQWTLAQGLPGLENLSLIPGSVGAAPIQNIGAYGSELEQFFHSLTIFDFSTGETRTLTHAQCRFGYRDSIFKYELRDRAVITEVCFALPKVWQPNLRYAELAAELAAQGCTQLTARDIADTVISIRRRKLPDPAKIGNAGSFFKNPVVSREQYAELLAKHPQLVSYPQPDGSFKLAAGWLIDQCGWKGKSMGAAGVHERQALVLVNLGGVSGAQILELASRIQSDVVHRFGVQLHPEPAVL